MRFIRRSIAVPGRTLRALAAVMALTMSFSAVALAAPKDIGDWSEAQSIETAFAGAHESFNTAALEGCPFVAPDGKTFFIASNRPGGLGGLDIWISTRTSANAGWGAPVNAGAPINTDADDFCPTLAPDGETFYFVSSRPGGCGGGDIYVSRMLRPGWDEPQNLGCDVNSPAAEFSPSVINEMGKGTMLYFSSNRPGGFAPEPDGAASGDTDLYVSQAQNGIFGAPILVPGVNTAAEDSQPNLSRDGLEMYFFSTRPGTLGMADIYVATRTTTSGAWATPVNLGPKVNTADGAETRPSLSWDGTTLYFGSNRPGGEGASDIYITTRNLDREDCQYFAETKQSLCFGFRAYWEQYGGLAIFGYPITAEVKDANGVTVQWFERARFEWHPGAWPERHDVLLGRIGAELAETIGIGFTR
jgi:hypothetical protein